MAVRYLPNMLLGSTMIMANMHPVIVIFLIPLNVLYTRLVFPCKSTTIVRAYRKPNLLYLLGHGGASLIEKVLDTRSPATV